MTNNYLVEQVTGYFGLVFWSLQLSPQAYKTYRRGTSTGVSVWTMLIWALAGTFMGVYNIGLGVSIALWIQPQIFTFIACICVAQEFRYHNKWTKAQTFWGFVALCSICAGIEVGLLFAFMKAQTVGNQHAITLFGVLPVISVLGGFLPQYYKIIRNRRVVGLSHLFIAMDISGSIFSTISLAFGDNMDPLDLANYVAIACLDAGIFVLYYVFEWYQKRIKTTKNDEEKMNKASIIHNESVDIKSTK